MNSTIEFKLKTLRAKKFISIIKGIIDVEIINTAEYERDTRWHYHICKLFNSNIKLRKDYIAYDDHHYPIFWIKSKILGYCIGKVSIPFEGNILINFCIEDIDLFIESIFRQPPYDLSLFLFDPNIVICFSDDETSKGDEVSFFIAVQ